MREFCDMKKYERLTERDKNNGKPFIPYKDYRTDKKINGYDDGYFDLLNRLAELEDDIEIGKLVRLPCKVGDVFYYASQLKNKVEKHIVTGFEISNELRIRTISDCYSTGNYVGYFYSSYFNKTLFKTKAEAEKKLEELKNANTCKQ